jgi:phage-related protein
MRSLGKSLKDLVTAVVGETLTVMTKVFRALINIGRKSVDILIALSGRTVSVLRTALSALISLNVSLASMVADIVTGVAQAFRRGFFEVCSRWASRRCRS